MKILIAEDDLDMQKIIVLYLKQAGYDVVTASDGNQALELIYENKFDLVILDWMMPYTDGIDVCLAIRKLGIMTKVLMLTAKDTTANEITGLSCGADDYIRKPFDFKLLLLRIKKLLPAENSLVCGHISLSPQNQIVTKDGNMLKLTKKEYELLHYFLQNPKVILSRTQLLNQIWGMDYEGDDRTVDTHIRRLRNKIGELYIITHVGLGYAMVNPND